MTSPNAEAAAGKYLNRDGCYGTQYGDHDVTCRFCPLVELLATFAAQSVRATWEEAAILACEDCRHGVALRQRENGMWQHAIAVYDKLELSICMSKKAFKKLIENPSGMLVR